MEAEERPNKIRKLGDDAENAQNQHQLHEILQLGDHIAERSSTSTSQESEVKIHGGHEGEASGLPPPDETAPAVATVQSSLEDPPLSKSKMKKLRKQAEWEAKRPERKALKKEKLQAKRERKREEKRQAAEANPEATNAPAPAQTPSLAVQLPITILIDCDFDDLMLDGERKSLATQITRSYSDNKSAPYRAHLTICSFGGELRKRFDTILTHYKNWKGLRTFDADFVETAELAREWMLGPESGRLSGIFSKYANLDDEARANLKHEGEVVYLTSEATEDLEELKPYSTYIIGGLVDKNREKGICYKRASRRNIRTAKLPIAEYMDMLSRKVLATNHVNEIMLKWLECGDWGEAFTHVIPKRKGGKLKSAVIAAEQGLENACETEDHGGGHIRNEDAEE